jgi:hypothetical protein
MTRRRRGQKKSMRRGTRKQQKQQRGGAGSVAHKRSVEERGPHVLAAVAGNIIVLSRIHNSLHSSLPKT